MKRKRYCYLVIHEKTPGLMWVVYIHRVAVN